MRIYASDGICLFVITSLNAPLLSSKGLRDLRTNRCRRNSGKRPISPFLRKRFLSTPMKLNFNNMDDMDMSKKRAFF